jgi:DNA-binding GntR family transcriptional regulator
MQGECVYTLRVAARLRPDELVDLLRRAIRERVLLPGQPLNQDELARRFGVSRIPLREALRTLAGEGLIVMRPGIGAVVSELRAQELEELFDLRLRLEPPLTAAVVGRVSASDLAELRQQALALDRRPAAGEDVSSWARQHHAFHRRLLEFAGQRHALRLLMQVVNLMEPYMRLSATLDPAPAESFCRHGELLDAIAAGDQEQVAKQVERSIRSARERLRSPAEPERSQDPLEALLVDMRT